METVRITIIGAGVVGLAIAAGLSKKHDNIILLERHEKFGRETSSRNSEVIHSGIYYPTDSLKAKLCIEGRALIYKYCEKNSVPCLKTGKLITASEQSQIAKLEELIKQGTQNGVDNLRILGKDEIHKIEPEVNAVAALHSPDTGIVDSHSLMRDLFKEAESSGVTFSFGTEINQIDMDKEGYILGIKDDDYKFRSRVVINSAGLSSGYIAGLAGLDVDAAGYRLKYCKGSYFSYAKKSPVNMLVYPVPHKDLTGLGVHATLDMGKRLRFGPDTEYVDSLDYTVDAGKRDVFYENASGIIKGLDKESFVPDMAGIRPKLQGPGEKTKDFVIAEETAKGFPGLINLIGIESPGLTASLSIAEMVGDIVTGVLN
jgi:L-2-hydroxyglutarate oxidase LhgO